MTEPPAPPAVVAAADAACPRCNGVGALVISTCCGRGCATCGGDSMLASIECYDCHGTGLKPPVL